MIKVKQIKENEVVTEVPAFIKNKPCNNRYRVYVTRDEGGKILVGIEQLFTSGNWSGTGGRWFLSTLLEGGVNDKLYMDYGQDWYVTGMKEVVDQIVEDYV